MKTAMHFIMVLCVCGTAALCSLNARQAAVDCAVINRDAALKAGLDTQRAMYDLMMEYESQQLQRLQRSPGIRG